MKRLIVLSSLVGVVALTACTPRAKEYNQGINIIPVPVELTQTEGVFTLDQKTTIILPESLLGEFQTALAYLGKKLSLATGYTIRAASSQGEGRPAENYIEFIKDTTAVTHPEGYRLVSTPQAVTITARTGSGAFYGMQTLLQLLPAEIESPKKVEEMVWSVPAVTINDYPRFDYRGMHLDPCRHFLPVEAVKKHLDVMAMYKYNKLHWHLTEDQLWTIEIKQYPDLKKGSVRTEGDGSTYGGWYTQEDIKEVVAYAAQLNIEIIPEIEMPGHAKAALVGYPQLSCTGGPFTNPRIIWGVEEDVFCAGNEEVFTFLQNVLREVATLFPSQYIHIGGDECPKVRWQNCPKCQALITKLGLRSVAKRTDAFGKVHTPEEALQSWFITRIDQFVSRELGKTIIGWDEILEGGLAPSAIVMSWRGEEGGIAAAQLGHKAIMTPSNKGYYLDQYQGASEIEPVTIGGYSTLERVYGYDPIPEALTPDQHQYIWGAQGNLWSEYMLTPERTEYMAYPRALAIAEVDWSPMERKDWADFQRRINSNHVRLDYHGINYHIPQPEDSLLTDIIEFTGKSTTLPLSNTRGYKMVYTLNGKEPSANSKEYTAPIQITKTTTVKAATLLPHGKLSPVRTILVRKAALRPAVAVEGDEPGMRVKIAEGLYVSPEQQAAAPFGEWTVVPRFGRSTPVGSNPAPGVQFDMNKPSLAVYEGYITLPEDGVYGFATDMDQLWIDDEMILQNGQESSSRHLRAKTTRALAAGKHTYRLVLNNMIKHGWPQSWNTIGFVVKAPGAAEYSRLPTEAFTYTPAR